MSNADMNRRQFFRIHQQLVMELQLLPQDTEVIISGQFEVAATFATLYDLHQHTAEETALLQRIQLQDSDSARYLQLISAKIDLLARAMTGGAIDFRHLIRCDVNLSEGGMLFYSSDALPITGLLSLKLIFPDSSIGLSLAARVLRCDPVPDTNQYELALEFIELPEKIRTLLARQILEIQTRQRKQLTKFGRPQLEGQERRHSSDCCGKLPE
ncbi:MAG: PilZ domain-containing protein [Marinobacterium sp.]|nr:PilZ domain-containing protein [Marinobacterium sp.]